MAFDLPTNFTNSNNVTGGIDGIGSLFEYSNYAVSGYFGLGLLAIIFIMTFTVSAMINFGAAFASASFVSFVFSVYFARIGAVTPFVPFVLMIMTIIGFFWAKSERGNY